MRIPPFERYASFTQTVAILLVGAIFGAIAYHAVYLMNFNALRTINSELEDKLADYEDRIHKLTQYRNQHSIVQTVLPILLETRENGVVKKKVDELTKAELKRRLKKDLDVFIGTSIYDIDSNAELARLLLNKKIYSAASKEYTVEIKTMLIVDNVLRVWFKARLYERPPG
ncbi:hypothetical protein PAECIP111893_04549 [Paenibacillus plantiphilus]|uniref:Sporulation membrane protein YtrI C-terminal domain-containing protein n=1 Tax=Paenibacillus plantiphilus TaxID=2905650 RepID=A0ABN8H015_9BACL|nr:hypothetical protein [Paenibacillus plantiphilus]CAH1219352.1 hypothetical protein PAECIP111893_04549 [Paenibacillus plantiphilus]